MLRLSQRANALPIAADSAQSVTSGDAVSPRPMTSATDTVADPIADALRQSVARFIERKGRDRLFVGPKGSKSKGPSPKVAASSSSTKTDWLDLDQLVDDVVKDYEVMAFRTEPLGVRQSILMEPDLTAMWKDAATPQCADSAALYFWIDDTAAMQMVQGLSRQFVATQSRKFVAAVVNVELRTLPQLGGHSLFGVVRCDDEQRDQYRYKMTALMTAKQIWHKFGIHAHDLPRPSRAEPELLEQLAVPRPIAQRDIAQIDWTELNEATLRSAKQSKHSKTSKAPSPSATPSKSKAAAATAKATTKAAAKVAAMDLAASSKSVAIAQSVMAEYAQIAADRLLSPRRARKTRNWADEMVPILVVDKVNEYAAIEWVLCIHIVHRNVNCAVAFRYEPAKDLFVATSVYSDVGVIESRHRLVGLEDELFDWR